MTSARIQSAPVRRQNALARVDFPTPGSPEKTTSVPLVLPPIGPPSLGRGKGPPTSRDFEGGWGRRGNGPVGIFRPCAFRTGL